MCVCVCREGGRACRARVWARRVLARVGSCAPGGTGLPAKRRVSKKKKKAPLTSWGNGQVGARWRVGKGARARRTLALCARRPGRAWAGVLGRADKRADARACRVALTL